MNNICLLKSQKQNLVVLTILFYLCIFITQIKSMDTPTSNDSFYETVCVPSIAPSLWSSTTCGILGFMGGAITSTSTNHITGAHLFQASPAFLILTGLCGGMFIGAITPPLMFLIAKKCCSD